MYRKKMEIKRIVFCVLKYTAEREVNVECATCCYSAMISSLHVSFIEHFSPPPFHSIMLLVCPLYDDAMLLQCLSIILCMLKLPAVISVTPLSSAFAFSSIVFVVVCPVKRH